MESGVLQYTMNPLKRDPENMHPEHPSPFGFRARSQLGWDSFLKSLSNEWE
jgi:hypothetical protein